MTLSKLAGGSAYNLLWIYQVLPFALERGINLVNNRVSIFVMFGVLHSSDEWSAPVQFQDILVSWHRPKDGHFWLFCSSDEE